MEQGEFDAEAIRLSLKPRLSRNELARKMDVSYSFMRALEKGHIKWPAPRKAKFEEIVSAWQSAPSPSPRKKRCDAGKTKKPERRARRASVHQMPVPVPHEHGQLVGVG